MADTSSGEKLTYHQARDLLLRLGGLDGGPDAPTEPRPPDADAPHRPSAPPSPAPSTLPALTADTLRRLLEAMPDALVVADVLGRIVLVNAQTEKLFGYRTDELLGQPVELLIPERFHERHITDRTRYTADPRIREMGTGRELMGLRKNGHEVPVEISLSPLRTPDGLLIVSTIRDVTERRRQESLLRKMEARYRTLVEGIPAVTFMAALEEGANERELYVSPQVEELLGFSQKEWLENPILWFEQLHPDDRRRWHEEFARTCAGGETFRSVYRFLSRDGRTVWVQGEARVVRDEDGRPLFLQGVAFDITGIKQAEGELLALNQTLEQRIEDRTRAVNERAEELERSNQALAEYAFFVAHELREPLSHAITYSQKLARACKDQLDPTAVRYLTTVLEAGTRMSDLIAMMLKYAKVGKEGKGAARTDCNRALASARAMLQSAIEHSNAAVTADSLPTVCAVESELAQVFQNLLSNAIKFRGERPVRVHVGVQRQGDHWRFSVRDNGIGIDPKFLAQKMFTIFKRDHGQSKYPGTGIGLALCKKVIEHHGGRIWAESTLGAGSTFHFTLPAERLDS